MDDRTHGAFTPFSSVNSKLLLFLKQIIFNPTFDGRFTQLERRRPTRTGTLIILLRLCAVHWPSVIKKSIQYECKYDDGFSDGWTDGVYRKTKTVV